jgi:hypothetical protein
VRCAINHPESGAFAQLEQLRRQYPRWNFYLDATQGDLFRANRRLIGISGGPLVISARSAELMHTLMHEQQARDVPYRAHDGWPVEPHEATPICPPSCLGVLTIADLADYVCRQGSQQ